MKCNVPFCNQLNVEYSSKIFEPVWKNFGALIGPKLAQLNANVALIRTVTLLFRMMKTNQVLIRQTKR